MSESLPYSEASRIAQFMGLPQWSKIDDVRLVRKVAAGLPTSTVPTIVKRIDPSGTLLSAFDLIPRATFYRRKDAGKPLTKDQSEMVYALTKVFTETMRQYKGDRDKAVQFLSRKHPMLDDRTPIDIARESTAGADLVMALLARADAGIPV